jgi:hypothetical protein
VTFFTVASKAAIYGLASIVLLFCFIWFLHGVFAPMGYGGRAPSAIIMFVLFGVLLPIGGSAYLAIRAINLARNNVGRAAANLICSIAVVGAGLLLGFLIYW